MKATHFFAWISAMAISVALTGGYHHASPNEEMANSYTVSTQGYHTAVVDTNGDLWAWGRNEYGNLGDGTTENRTQPILIMDHVNEVKASLFGTMIWKADGTVWVCGRTPFFQEDQLIPIQIPDDVLGDLGKLETVDIQAFDSTSIYLLNQADQLWEWTKNGETELYLDNVVSFSCCGGCFAAVKSDDTLWTWGLNEYGGLGIGTLEDDFTPRQVMSDVKAAVVGSGFLCALKKDGTLWCCGRNDYGQLGNGTTIGSPNFTMVMEHVKTVSAGFFHVVARKEDNTLWQWGGSIPLGGTTDNKDTWIPITEPVQIMEDVTAAMAGANHTIAIKGDGSVWSWGYNKYGALGYHDENTDDGTTFLTATPKQIPGLKVAVPDQ